MEGDGGLQSLCVEMTPVFEMIKGWTIEKIDQDTLYQAAIQDGAIVIAIIKTDSLSKAIIVI